MNNLEKTLAAISAAEMVKNAAGARVDALTNEKSGFSVFSLKRERTPEEEEKYNAATAEIMEEAEKETNAKLSILYLNNNAAHDTLTLVWPYLKSILHKYAGKKAGPKTTEKMKKELFNACGYYFYFHTHYSRDEITVIPINPATNCTDYRRPEITIARDNMDYFLIDNIIQEPDDSIHAAYRGSGEIYVNTEYYDDLPATIEAAKKAYQAVKTAALAYEEARKIYDKIRVHGMNETEYLRQPYHDII